MNTFSGPPEISPWSFLLEISQNPVTIRPIRFISKMTQASAIISSAMHNRSIDRRADQSDQTIDLRMEEHKKQRGI